MGKVLGADHAVKKDGATKTSEVLQHSAHYNTGVNTKWSWKRGFMQHY